MISRHGRLLTLASALVVATSLVRAQQTPAPNPVQKAPLSQVVPTDEAITIGTLPNGLRYYIRANSKPEKRAELRLVVKAGSVLEEDDQQGLAHLIEHMAFNGTAHFPKQELVQFLESLGMRFGADINASTSFDETIFTLQVPTDKPETMDRSLLILEDWAHNVTFDPATIDKERGVVMEEWRLRRGAGARALDKLFPILLKGSRYADRIPIGKTEVIQGAKPERLKQFYTDWYRPDLMAVVAVGDFDTREIEKLIKAHFASIPKPAAPKPRPAFDVPDHPGTLYAITTDKETTSTSVEIENLLPSRKQGTIGVYRQEIVDQLFGDLLSTRLSEMSQKPDAPFMRAGAGRGQFIGHSKDEASLSALVKDDGVDRGLTALLDEAARVSQFGFTSTELDRARQTMLRGRERLLAETSNRVSASRADEYVRNFVEDEPLPTGQYEYWLNERFLPEITLDEVNRIAKDWFTDRNRIVVVNAPEKAGVAVPDEATLASIIKAEAEKKMTAYVDTVAGTVLMETPPPAAPNAIVKTTSIGAAGITEWQLANGVKVVLKPTTFKEDEIMFRATSPGGTSLASDQDYIPASTATQVINAGGVGAFSGVELRKVLTGKIASASPSIGELEEGMSGGSSRQDLETMFQLIYLRFTQPRADAAIFGVMTSQMRTIVANQSASPDYAFLQMLTSTLSQNHPRRRLPTAASIDQWNLDKSLAFYRDRFADASDFTFVFVGSFDVQTIKPLVERYLGALPSIHRKETWKDVGVRPPSGVLEKTVEKGIEPKSETAIVFSGPFEYDQMHRVAIRAMAEILQARLLTTIREELGGTYSISASASTQKNPRPEYSIGIQFGSDPQRTAALNERILQEVEKYKAEGPTDKQLGDEREALLRDFEVNATQNGYLLGQLTARYDVGEDPAGLWNMPEYYRKIDAAMIKDAANMYLNMNNRVRVTLVPESKPKE